MAAPTDWVPDVTREAMTRILAHTDKVGLVGFQNSVTGHELGFYVAGW